MQMNVMTSSRPVASSYYTVIASDSRLIHLFEHLIMVESNSVLPPSFDPCSGYFYPDIVKGSNVSPKESLEVANKIISLGLGTKEYHDQVLRCPYCGAEQIRVIFHCPFCNSTQLYKELLLEHIHDGVIGPISRFKRGGDLVCPNCGTKLAEEGRDYRTVGVWYRCLSCYKQADTPKIAYPCRSCGKEVTAHGLVISSVWALVINKEALKEFSRLHIVIRPVVDLLRRSGYMTNSPATLTGRSGVVHSFDVLGLDKTGKTVAVDIVVSKELLDESVIMSLFAKVLDTSPTKTILVCIPGIVETAKKLASTYGITILEGPSINEAIARLKDLSAPQSFGFEQASLQ